MVWSWTGRSWRQMRLANCLPCLEKLFADLGVSKMLRKMTRWLLAASLIVGLAGWGSAAPYSSGPLPPEFTNPGDQAWLPTEPKMFVNQMAISKEQTKLLQRSAKCYTIGAKNYSKGKPTLLFECLASVEAKYQLKLEKIRTKPEGLPVCHAYEEEAALSMDSIGAAIPDLLCASPEGAFVDGAVIL